MVMKDLKDLITPAIRNEAIASLRNVAKNATKPRSKEPDYALRKKAEKILHKYSVE
jgi:hypothetical protein